MEHSELHYGLAEDLANLRVGADLGSVKVRMKVVSQFVFVLQD